MATQTWSNSTGSAAGTQGPWPRGLSRVGRSEGAWPRLGSPGCWSPASLGTKADLGLSQRLPLPASRNLRILGLAQREERGFSMLVIVPMTRQEQSSASCRLLPPASAQLFWPRSPISSACLWEHWAFVSFQNHGCVLRVLCPSPPPPAPG